MHNKYDYIIYTQYIHYTVYTRNYSIDSVVSVFYM